LYYFSLHRIVGKRNLAISTLILTIFTGLGLILVIAATGGLDSPFYAFWLLAIVTAGIFGTADTLVVLGLTTAYYLFALYQHGFEISYVTGHLAQLFLSLIAGGLSEWVYWRTKRMQTQTAHVSHLTGQLTEEQLKAQVLMSAMAEGVMVVDSSRRIQLFNQAAQTTTGWDESSAQNLDWAAVVNLTIGDTAIAAGQDPVTLALQTGTSQTADNLTLTTRAGHKIPVYVSVSPVLNDKGALTGAITLFRDISKEKEIERQKDEFVSTASHEMRTPVAAIEGYISLAMNANVATVDDRAMGYLNKAHDAIKHLGELFRDLLSVTKAEEGQLKGPLTPTNVTELVKSAVDDMQFTASGKGLTLVFQSSDTHTISPIFWSMAVPERLREVVMNLIDNSVKFTQQGGVTVTLAGDDKEVTVAVADTGVGISKEDAAHLFQKFYRVDNSATRTIGGTGLGLYLCRRLIELFGGRIWVESEFTKGSKFIFSLPRITEEEAQRKIKELAGQTLPQTSNVQTIPGVSNIPGMTANPTPTAPVATPVVAMPVQPAAVAAPPAPVPVLAPTAAVAPNQNL
jgi:PAS domain S-box-containing protein